MKTAARKGAAVESSVGDFVGGATDLNIANLPTTSKDKYVSHTAHRLAILYRSSGGSLTAFCRVYKEIARQLQPHQRRELHRRFAEVLK